MKAFTMSIILRGVHFCYLQDKSMEGYQNQSCIATM